MIDCQNAVVAHFDATIALQPSESALDFPASAVAPQLAPVLPPPAFAVATVRNQQLDPALLQSLPQWVGVVGAVGDDALGFLPRPPASPARHPHVRERRFRQRDLCRRSARELRSQRNALAIDQYHALCPLPTLGFSHSVAPFLAATKLPSRKVSSHSSSWWWFSAASSCCQASTQTPSSSHCRSRRQQVEPLGYNDGRSRQRAPVLSTHRMPSTQARFAAQGRPRPSRRRFGCGKKCSINSHCRSVSRMPPALLHAACQRKCLIRVGIYL